MTRPWWKLSAGAILFLGITAGWLYHGYTQRFAATTTLTVPVTRVATGPWATVFQRAVAPEPLAAFAVYQALDLARYLGRTHPIKRQKGDHSLTLWGRKIVLTVGSTLLSQEATGKFSPIGPQNQRV